MLVFGTVPTTSARRVVKGNGIGTVFSTDFVFLDPESLIVTLVEADGDQIILELGTDYSVQGGGGNTGSVVLNEAPETGELVVIERQEAYLQKLDLEGADPFNANTVETAFDRVVMMIQQLLDLARRAIVGPKTRDPNADPLEMPEPEAGRFLIGRQDEKGWENTDLADAVAEFDPNLLSIPVPVADGGTGQQTAAAMLRANYLTTTGDNSAYAATSAPATPSLVDGLIVRIQANHTATQQPTFNLDETGDKNILDAHGQALPNGGLQANGIYELSYDAGLDAWLSLGHTRPYVSKLSNVRLITSNQLWAKPGNLDYIEVEVVGGGGGSGGCSATGNREVAASGGGGGGEYAYKRIPAANLNATETITIGAAGAAGAEGNNDGGDGGNTSFGNHVTAAGGKGGKGSADVSSARSQVNLGGLGGTGGTGGDVHIAGSPGRAGVLCSDESSGSNDNGIFTQLGDGGDGGGPLGGGGGRAANRGVGAAGGNYGGGGGGSSERDGAAKPGAAGGKGVCLIKEYTFEYV